MSSTEVYTPKDVLTDMNYCAASEDVYEAASLKQRYLGVPDENTRKMTIHDIRNRESDFTLRENGFQFIKLPAKDRHEYNSELVRTEYYEELRDLLKELTGADKVYVFNHCIRAALQTRAEGNSGEMHIPELNGPSGHPHCDYSPLREHNNNLVNMMPFPDDGKELAQKCSRYFFVGTWKPIKTLQRNPLCVADVNTVPESDFKLKVRKNPDGSPGSNTIISHGSKEEQHKWYYLNAMTPDEIVVFAGYDTNHDRPGWRCPHNSFHIPGTENFPPRESIECRAICLWE